MVCFHINLNWPQVNFTNHIKFKFLCHYIGNKDSQERNLRVTACIILIQNFSMWDVMWPLLQR